MHFGSNDERSPISGLGSVSGPLRHQHLGTVLYGGQLHMSWGTTADTGGENNIIVWTALVL